MKRKKVSKIGLFEKIFKEKAVSQATGGYFETLTAYMPSFTTFSGGIYEALLCRAAIHTFASHCSKLRVEVEGTDEKLKKILGFKPNCWQTTSQFLYRLATILETDTTAFIVPILDASGKKIEGFFPVRPASAVIKEYMGREYIQFFFPTGRTAVIESEHVGIVTKYQYTDDIFGSGNAPIKATAKVLDTHDQALDEGIKSNAAIRFMAVLAGVYKKKDIEEAKRIFTEQNLVNNRTGVMMFDEKFRDVKQMNSSPVYVDAEQAQQIKNNVYDYFGVNEDILMNKYNEEGWDSYYEGKIEPFAIQASEILTSIIYSVKGFATEERAILSSNRLAYASNKTKLNVVTQMFDRGMMTKNQGLEIFNMPKVEDGDKFYIRKEYAEVDKLNEAQGLIE